MKDSKNDLRVRVINDRNASAASVRARVAGRVYETTGASKREPGDVASTDIGGALAVARAFRRLAAVIEADAAARVTQAEQARKAQADARLFRRLTSPRPLRALLTLPEIEGKYGPEAARRAQVRRARAGVRNASRR